MKQKIDELIEKYKNKLKAYMEDDEDVFFDDMFPDALLNMFLSDLEELKKLAEVNSKLTDFVNSQEPMPADFKKVVDENFWDLI